MQIFTYNDYLKSIHTLRLNAVFQLAEESTKYNLEIKNKKRKINNAHDEIIRKILINKKEVANIINNFIESKEKIKEGDLEKYTNNYLEKKYKSKEAEIIYKLKNKNVYYLIKHQSTIDNEITFKMLNYCVDIIYNWNTLLKAKEKIEYPIVVPIVIYTGIDKWQVENDFSKMQVSDYVFKNYKIEFKYNLIEINQLSKEILINNRTVFSSVMLLAKAKSFREFKNVLNEILYKNKDKEKIKKEVYDISIFLFEKLINDSYSQEFSKKINFKIRKGEEEMASLYEKQIEGFRKDLRNLLNEYIQEKENNESYEIIKNIVKNLIVNNSSDEFIIKVTRITKNNLEEIKKELLVNNGT